MSAALCEPPTAQENTTTSAPAPESTPVSAAPETPVAEQVSESAPVHESAVEQTPASEQALVAEQPASPAAAPASSEPATPVSQPWLVVIRGQKVGAEYPIYPDLNFIGRADEKPADIDLEDQENPDRIWSSRQHAVISYTGGALTIEDLNSANGTYVNRTRIYPGQHSPLDDGDVIQIGTVQMKVKMKPAAAQPA